MPTAQSINFSFQEQKTEYIVQMGFKCIFSFSLVKGEKEVTQN